MATRTPPRATPRLGKGARAGFALWRDAMRWQRAVDGALRPLGLTHTQLLVLASLDGAFRQATEAVTQAAIAEEAELDPVTTAAVLRTLEARGFLSRDVGREDRRAWRISPTREGERALASAAPLVEAASTEFARSRRP